MQPAPGQSNPAHSSTQERKLLQETSGSPAGEATAHTVSKHANDGKSWHGRQEGMSARREKWGPGY